jgi:hypothetical protein
VKSLTVVVPDFVRDQIGDQVILIARHSIKNAFDWESRVKAAIQSLAHTHGHARDEDASRRF